MTSEIIQRLAGLLSLSPQQVKNTIALLDEGATVPFISRYRKERTGSLDEVQIGAVKNAKVKMEELLKRREIILKTIEEQGQLTDGLKSRIESCYDLTVLEDIYLPFKPKRKTRATIAREKGLEPLSGILMKQAECDIERKVPAFVKGEVETVEDALAGARDILAEWISENEKARNMVRHAFDTGAVIKAKVVKNKEAEGEKYRDYFDWEEPLKYCPSHRLLAMRRGEHEGFLRISLAPDEEHIMDRLIRHFVHSKNTCGEQVEQAVKDSYKRLLAPSIETEFSGISKRKADQEAIRVFAENLRQLLLAAPLGQKRVMAIDPGYRTGCKVVAWMRRVICFITKQFIRISRRKKQNRQPAKSFHW